MFRLLRLTLILLVPLMVLFVQYKDAVQLADQMQRTEVALRKMTHASAMAQRGQISVAPQGFSDFDIGETRSVNELAKEGEIPAPTEVKELGYLRSDTTQENAPGNEATTKDLERVAETAVEAAVEAETPAEETPVVETPADETPGEETPVEEIQDNVPEENTPKQTTPSLDLLRDETLDKTVAREKKDKLKLVLHVGPPKTATTSIQMDLSQFTAELDQDGYHYTGRYLNPYRKWGLLYFNRTYEPIVDYAADMFAESQRSKEENVALFQEELAKYLTKGKDVIISDEGLCGRYKDQSYYEELREIIGDDWDVELVFGYRYFHQWLASAQFQKNRMDQRNKWKDAWPSEKAELYRDQGKVPELIFPNLVNTWEQRNDHFTKNIIDHNNGTLPFKYFNIHDKSSSPRTKFLCDMLNADHSCQRSKALDAQNQSSHMNLREDIIHTYYDIVTTTAAEKGLIDVGKYLRRDVREAMRVHNEEELKQTHTAFELDCPSQAEYDAYLNQSLELEKEVYGEQIASTMEAAHREDFQEKVESNLYCNVDAEAVLEHQEWKDFFAQFSTEDSPKVTSER